MHGNNFCGSPRVSPTRVEEDDEHRHDDEEAQAPQEVVQEDVDLCAAAVVRSLPEERKISIQKEDFQSNIEHLTWVDRDRQGSRVFHHQILLSCLT